MVALADELSGSDGDIVTAAIKRMGIGPVVGVRTWGGVIGIDGRYALVDGTRVTQPRYAFWFDDVGWEVENRGVAPDVEVVIRPQDWVAGRDPQLERAVDMALAALDRRPAARPPDPATRPSRVRPRARSAALTAGWAARRPVLQDGSGGGAEAGDPGRGPGTT